MGTVCNDGLMALVMRACGRILKLVARESFGTLTVIFLKENGKTIKLMALEFTLISMELVTLDIGKRISSMVKVKSSGSTEVNTMVTIIWVRNMDMESTGGQTVVHMKVTGLTIR